MALGSGFTLTGSLELQLRTRAGNSSCARSVRASALQLEPGTPVSCSRALLGAIDMTNQITVCCWRKCFIPSSSNNKNLSSTAFLQPGASDFFKPQLGAPVCKHRQPRDPVLEDCEFQPEPETPVCSQPQPGTQVWDGAFPTESRGAGCNSLQRQSPSLASAAGRGAAQQPADPVSAS